ncbi:hypothetical protein MLD38_017702 [Melastoma candidum]|uniref:Uncharacterized protein n=1 Tax=Melastoma candidum TaxID=119954 RepID=A0ACB9QRI1_9MYRT|nr:hypothetical protein MLD38_017702 [Melastoma candidum]
MAIHNGTVTIAPRVAVAVIICLLVGVRNEPDITPIGYTCFGQLDPLSQNQAAVQVVLDRLIDNTADRAYNYYTSSRRGGARCFGHAICRNTIPHEDCITCLIVAETILQMTCGFPGSARLKLVDCGLRWQFNRYVDDI